MIYILTKTFSTISCHTTIITVVIGMTTIKITTSLAKSKLTMTWTIMIRIRRAKVLFKPIIQDCIGPTICMIPYFLIETEAVAGFYTSQIKIEKTLPSFRTCNHRLYVLCISYGYIC